MNANSIQSFFYDFFNIQYLDIETVALDGEEDGKQIQISTLNTFDSNNIDVESCLHTVEATFCAYRPY